MKIKEPEVMQEIRAVRNRMARRVEQEGILAFCSSLKGHAEKLMALHHSPKRAAPPRSIEARRAKRRALVDALPEPRAIQEIHRIREEMQYVESPSADVLHDKPAKK